MPKKLCEHPDPEVLAEVTPWHWVSYCPDCENYLEQTMLIIDIERLTELGVLIG